MARVFQIIVVELGLVYLIVFQVQAQDESELAKRHKTR
jgi:hypothetical protein